MDAMSRDPAFQMSQQMANPPSQGNMRGTTRLADWTPPYSYDPMATVQPPPAFFTHEHWITSQANPSRDDRRHHALFPDIFPGNHPEPYRNREVAENPFLVETIHTLHRTNQMHEREG